MDELVDRIRHAADHAGEAHFLELLRWHRVVAGLGEPDRGARGAYRIAITDLGEDRAAELLGDLRRLVRNLAATVAAPMASLATAEGGPWAVLPAVA